MPKWALKLILLTIIILPLAVWVNNKVYIFHTYSLFIKGDRQCFLVEQQWKVRNKKKDLGTKKASLLGLVYLWWLVANVQKYAKNRMADKIKQSHLKVKCPKSIINFYSQLLSHHGYKKMLRKINWKLGKLLLRKIFMIWSKAPVQPLNGPYCEIVCQLMSRINF